jgi:MFS-type transporter involved in bile tolerance (Atg22 family)
MTGSMRNSMLFMALFFAVGILILQTSDLDNEMKRIEEMPEVEGEAH